ncbi:MAG TPA: adenosine deaminase, partial [Anaerolineae bacterium]|nr:adenosine deaminase [Anaerolineae bacterium]
FSLVQQVLADYDACRRITWENLEDAVREGIDYVELRFSPLFMGERHGLDPMGVTSAICEAWQEARGRLPVQAKLIVIMSRTYGPEACWAELAAAVAHRDRGVVGLDLAGDEAGFPAHLFAEHYRRAQAADLRRTVHAGEFAGADSIRQAVLELGAERIGHGVHAADDPAVMDLLAERQIAIESCPTSNVQFGVVPGYAAHPLPLFLRRGLCVTLNTDDPGISGIDLAHEYRIARQELGLSEAEVRRLQENGVQAAFLPPGERAALVAH